MRQSAPYSMTHEEKLPSPSGVPHAIMAYVIWGFIPVFFKLLGSVAPIEIVAQRILWSVPLLMIILFFRRQIGEFSAIFRHKTHLRNLAVSASLIAINWLIYIWAVANDHVLATSLGYYLNPLVNVLLGRLFLGERLRPMQMAAVGVAAIGVAILLSGALDTLWISITLAFSFGSYGLVRKITPVGSVPGLAVETTLLAPFSLAFIYWLSTEGDLSFGSDLRTSGLLILCGLITATPLLLFATAARRMSYTSLGFIQYLAPTIVFILSIFVFNEPLNSTKLICFTLIWVSIAIFCFDALRNYRAGRR
jgi:chloramphenicol-sensitive protein RarD